MANSPRLILRAWWSSMTVRRRARRACDVTMTNTLKPRDAKDAEAAVGLALAEGKTLEIVGQSSKRGIGRAAQWDLSLDLSDLRA